MITIRPDFAFDVHVSVAWCDVAGEWQNLRMFIISELSPRFLQGYVAKDLGCSVLEESYYFGLANERKGDKGVVSEKLRVIIAKQELLQNYEAHASAAELVDGQTGKVMYDQGQPVELAKPYFEQRWKKTMRNMADLYHDPDSKSLRQIELSLAASRVALEQVDTKLREIYTHTNLMLEAGRTSDQ